MTPMPEVVPDNTVEAPSTFEAYEAKRIAEMTAEPVDVEDDTEAPEPAASEPAPTEEAKETAPAAEIQPEPTVEPGTTEETQEQKAEREKKGIPQSRLDEVTKARREAERLYEAEKSKSQKLEEELAQLKAKPAAEEVKTETQPEPAKDEPRIELPEKPKAPKLEDESIGGDWELYEKARDDYQEKLTDWKLEVREIERKAKEAKAAKDAPKPEPAKAADPVVTARIAKAREKYPDLDKMAAATPGTPVMAEALASLDDGADVLAFLSKNTDEAQRIARVTSLPENYTPEQARQAFSTAFYEIGKISAKLGEAKPEPKPAAPANPKPLVSRAPAPITTVNPGSAPGSSAKEAATNGDFEAYQQRRARELTRR